MFQKIYLIFYPGYKLKLRLLLSEELNHSPIIKSVNSEKYFRLGIRFGKLEVIKPKNLKNWNTTTCKVWSWTVFPITGIRV